MHEVSLMQSVLSMAFEQARTHNATKITTITLHIGALAGVVPEALDFAFESLKKGTIAETAKLNVESVPLTCYCRKCEAEFLPKDYSSLCPTCGGRDIEIRRGLEMNLASIEVP
jgi:hydrogenase nickel incorporation protein HypA/HybF